MQAPLGWVTEIWMSALVVVAVGVVVVSSATDTAVLMKAVSSRFGGLAQPEVLLTYLSRSKT
jgi:hypothetical protein